MIQAVVQPHEIGIALCERAAVILRLLTHKISPDWVKEFSLPELAVCCERMDALPLDMATIPDNVQRELIQNSDFVPWLTRMLSFIVEEPANNGEAENVSPPHLDEHGGLQELSNLLEAGWAHQQTVTAYQPASVLAVLEHTRLSYSAKLAYLAGYPQFDPSVGRGALIRKHLTICGTVPVPMSEAQRSLLEEPFVGTRYLFAADDFEKIAELFSFCPSLTDIARLLHQGVVPEDLRLVDYMYFAEDAPEYLRLLAVVLERLGNEGAGQFIHFWQRSNCALSELQRMEYRTRTNCVENWADVLSTYSGYVDVLYGSRFKTFTLSSLTDYQEKILTYAIVSGKKHFIKLIDGNGEKFLSLPHKSVLFCEELYRVHFNLNELSEKDLSDCTRMTVRQLPKELLESVRQYTFAELKLLYDMSEAYVTLYGMLRRDDLDYRVKVFRQLQKRNALNDVEDKANLPVLAELLNQKSLHDWRRGEFGQIEGLTAGDTVKMLIHLEELRHLIPTMRGRTDAILALRSLSCLGQFDSIDALKASLLETDREWHALQKAMGLSPEFVAQHQENIVRFLCLDGAGIAQNYMDNLDDEQRTAFQRVVKAELMGQFNALRYYEGDLERELDHPVPPQMNAAWQKKLSTTKGGMAVQERDDFFSTILLGTQPYRTCLAYSGGAYCRCLLACFDSNKKLLYAEAGGHIVGRASIRLTKCRRSGEGKKEENPGNQFSFVDLEDAAGSRGQKKPEGSVALFLERPYISGANPEAQSQIKAMFVELARQKAEEMGVMLALSMDYHGSADRSFVQTRLALYISASKAGSQYLDSLGGKAAVSSEGSYHNGSFLMRPADTALAGLE